MSQLSGGPSPGRLSAGGGDKPSIRLNLSAAAAQQPPSKKRRFTPQQLPPQTARASDLAVLHQSSCLHFVLLQPANAESKWYCQGTTCLYLIVDESSVAAAAGNTTPPSPEQQLALHLRGACVVTDVKAECCVGLSGNASSSPTRASLQSLRVSSCFHADPLQHVLIKPPSSYTEDDAAGRQYKFDADSQSTRGAVGMTTGLRAASIASNMGELRLSVVRPTAAGPPADRQAALIAWKNELAKGKSADEEGAAIGRLQNKLRGRSKERVEDRIHLIAGRLAEASCSKEKGNRAFKLTVSYKIPMDKPTMHMAGLHSFTTNRTPHIYTTAGVIGDHEGPRCWLPCLDSAASKHRASQELTVMVTASLGEGLSCVGLGEDFGCSEAFLHDSTWDLAAAEAELGTDHVAMIQSVWQQIADGGSANAHLIPPNANSSSGVISIDSVRVTAVWRSSSWSPIPARSLGFAVGPFKILEDPEYFVPYDMEGDDEEDEFESLEDRQKAFVQAARDNGEGIRQAYFAPLFERKHIHANASMKLLPNTQIKLDPLTQQQKETCEGFDKTVICATVGIPHRALSLMREVLALPVFRTVSYTQVWIPGAVHGGTTSGSLHCCPEVSTNQFLGGAIMDAGLLPPVGSRLPFFQGGRVLQLLQARCAIRGWIAAALPLGGNDDVGNGYIYALIESLIMSLYERGHAAHGEGGAKGGTFFSLRYSVGSGSNSPNLAFLNDIQNIEEMDVVIGGVGAVPVEARHIEQLWRSSLNGSESHTGALDEFNVRQLLCKDVVEALERGTDKDKHVPLPSMGWLGSYLSLSFLSSNASSSSDLGCGAVELLHPVGGVVYRFLKSEVLRGVVEGRAGVANFIRLVRAAFISAHLDDIGEEELKLPSRREKKSDETQRKDQSAPAEATELPKPPFVTCVNEILKKKGLSHNLFTRALQNLSGGSREPHLLGTLVDVERDAEDPRADPRTRRPFVDAEGFPNSYVRGASLLYCRVGVHVEFGEGTSTQQQSGTLAAKGFQMQAYAEPIIPEGGIAYGGPITVRVIENEGQFREYVKELKSDGSRRDWGSTFLHAKPVTTVKAQKAASGTIERSSAPKDAAKSSSGEGASAFTETNFHRGGYQAIELIRLTNLTPLLWVRVDPLGLFGGRISVCQPAACLAEQLYHDGDAGAQVDALRALAERPLPIEGSLQVTAVYDVNVSELPVRVLGDCLRGSPALHSSEPHSPTVRSQAALAIAQWQNNKAPKSKDTVGADSWVGMDLLLQYFLERFYSSSVVMPVKVSRLSLKRSPAEVRHSTKASEGDAANPKPAYDDTYQYLDTLEEGEERAAALQDAEEIEMEEDEEYRVRSSVVTAIASTRAKDGLTPPRAIEFLETVLQAEDAETVGNIVYSDEKLVAEQTLRRMKSGTADEAEASELEEISEDRPTPHLSFVSSMLVADALLALCHINARPATITDPTTGKLVQSTSRHPVSRLLEIARRWLEWELYRERIRSEHAVETSTGIVGSCHNTISVCAVLALSCLTILKQTTTDASVAPSNDSHEKDRSNDSHERDSLPQRDHTYDNMSSPKFYSEFFDRKPPCNDLTKAACAQALACICCAADRMEEESVQPVGLLSALEFMLDRIVDDQTSPSLRQTLSLIMMDACTGKVCSLQRIGAIAGRNDLITSAARFLNGPLGASHGGDNGSAVLLSVSAESFPAANAVNDGARRGLKLLIKAGHGETAGEDVVVRVARFATRLWRTINGEPADPPEAAPRGAAIGVCAHDGALRSSLLSLWQWIWPKDCFAVQRVQAWKAHEGTQRYWKLGAQHVMKISEEEEAAATAEEKSWKDISRLVNIELDRQVWRGEMAKKAYEIYQASKRSAPVPDVGVVEQGIGQPLPPIQRDPAFKQGGWITSAAKQRRQQGLDGGTVTKVRLKVKSSSEL